MDKTVRILLLEDNPADAEMVKFELEESGIPFTAKVVMTEEDFIHELQAFSPDLILSDYDLPRYTGASALAEANRGCPDVPFILVTGAVTEERAIEILTSGARDFVMKNRLGKLVPAIRRTLAETEAYKAKKKAEENLREAHRDLEIQVEKRTAELLTVLDAAPVGIWIAHDPECRIVTGNAYADEMIMKTSRGSNISASSASGEAAVSYKVFHDSVELKPEEMPAQVAAATGKPVTDIELELVFSDGRHIHLIESAIPLFDSGGRVRGAVITGADVSRLKQSENALRDIEERQRLVLQASSLGTFEYDLLTGETIWNEAEFDLFGLHPGDAQDGPDTFFRFVHPDDLGMMQEQWEGAKRTGKLDAEFRIIRADGQIRWLAGKGCFILGDRTEGDEGQPARRVLRFMGVNFDITENKRNQAEVARLATFPEQNPMAVIEADMAGQVLYVNPAARHLFPDLQELGRHHPWLADFESFCDAARTSGEERPAVRDVTVAKQDYCQIAYHDRNTGLIRIYGYNITEQRQSEILSRSLNEINARILSTHNLDEILDGVCTGAAKAIGCDSAAVSFRYADGWRIAHVHGFPKEVIGSKIVDEEEPHAMRAIATKKAVIINDTFNGGSVHREHMKKRNVRSVMVVPIIRESDAIGVFFFSHHNEIFDFTEAHLDYASKLVSSVTLAIANAQLVHKVLEELTERKKTEEELREKAQQLEAANRELESFSYSASHDLRAPLRAIDGYLRMILKRQGDQLDEETRRQFDQVRNSTTAMNQLIDDLLALSKLSRQDLDLKILDIGRLIEKAWQELQKDQPDRNMTLKVNLLPPVRGDEGLMKQVVVNLLSNAVKFTRIRDTAMIEVGGYEKENETVYYVKDNGVGFDMKYHDKLFGVFQRLHRADEYEGTGIGLSIVQRIVHRHGGRVWAESKEGEGATIYFALPERGLIR